MLPQPCHTLYRCAVEEPSVASELWSDYLRSRPLDDFQGCEFRLVPAIWSNLSKCPDGFAEQGRVKGIYRYSLTKNAALKRQCESLVLLLQKQEIPVLILKGIVLSLTVHQSLGYRPASDVDLLVPFDRIDEAADLLLGQGWRPKETYDPHVWRLEHAITLVKDGLELDLHYFLVREARHPGNDEPFWERAVPFTCGQAQALTLDDTDLLFLLIICATRDEENYYRYLLDIEALLRKKRPDLPRLYGILRAHRLLHRVTYLPLGQLGWPQPEGVSAQDKLWSWCSRYVQGGRGEWSYAVFPFADYWFHYIRSHGHRIGFGLYLQRRLKVTGWKDFWVRSVAKFRRMIA